MSLRFPLYCFIAVMAMALLGSDAAADNLPPVVQITQGPMDGDTTHYANYFQWTASDPDGAIATFQYAVDPGVSDTSWIATTDTVRLLVFTAPTPATPYAVWPDAQYCYGPHTVVVRAIDDGGLASAPVSRTFVSSNEAPSVAILSPAPSPFTYQATSIAPLIDWAGNDPDGVFFNRPVVYRMRLATRSQIQATLGIAGLPSATDLQTYFSLEAPDFGSWDTASADSSHVQYSNLTLGQEYYLAVVGFDEAGGWDPRFRRDRNVLVFRSTFVSGVESPVTGAIHLASPSPNPAQRAVAFRIELPSARSVRLEVFDASGRRVRTLGVPTAAGRTTVSWNLKGDRGAKIRPGVYEVRLSVDGGTRSRRFVVTE